MPGTPLALPGCASLVRRRQSGCGSAHRHGPGCCWTPQGPGPQCPAACCPPWCRGTSLICGVGATSRLKLKFDLGSAFFTWRPERGPQNHALSCRHSGRSEVTSPTGAPGGFCLSPGYPAERCPSCALGVGRSCCRSDGGRPPTPSRRTGLMGTPATGATAAQQQPAVPPWRVGPGWAELVFFFKRNWHSRILCLFHSSGVDGSSFPQVLRGRGWGGRVQAGSEARPHRLPEPRCWRLLTTHRRHALLRGRTVQLWGSPVLCPLRTLHPLGIWRSPVKTPHRQVPSSWLSPFSSVTRRTGRRAKKCGLHSPRGGLGGRLRTVAPPSLAPDSHFRLLCFCRCPAPRKAAKGTETATEAGAVRGASRSRPQRVSQGPPLLLWPRSSPRRDLGTSGP